MFLNVNLKKICVLYSHDCMFADFFYILIFNLIFLIYSITFKISLIFNGLKVNRIRVLEKEEKLWILKTNTKIQALPEKANYSVSNDHWLDFLQTTQ